MKKWILPLVIALVLLLALGLLVPRVLPAIRTYQALTSFLETRELSVDLTARLSLGETSWEVQAQLDRVDAGGKQVTVLSQNGKSVYYANGLLYLENGRAYRLTEPTGEKPPIWKGILWLLRYGKVESTGSGYAVSLQGEQAQMILNGLLPGVEAIVLEVDSLSLALVTDDSRLACIRFQGSGWLGEDRKTPLSLEVSGNIGKVAGKVTLPEDVEKAIASGDPSRAEPLTENLIRLFSALWDLGNKQTLAGKLTLSADCGPLALDKTLDLLCWQLEGKRVYSLQENGVGLYYGNGTLCDGSGHSLSLEGSAGGSALRLPELLLGICLELTGDCAQMEDSWVYRFALDEEAMSALAYAIVPEAEKLPVSLTAGTLEVILTQEQLESVNLRIDGTLSLLLTQVDVSIGGKIDLEPGEADAVLPEAVRSALLEP